MRVGAKSPFASKLAPTMPPTPSPTVGAGPARDFARRARSYKEQGAGA
ncbi:hypothetical protein PCLA_02f0453 [Pseudomonas citronellolis]|nr:hypothetical protein PCLA_02f0453 [Pseudomonas citronellolis]